MRVFKQCLVALCCIGLFFALGLLGMTMALETFAPGGDVTFTERQIRISNAGDMILETILYPAHLLGFRGKAAFPIGSCLHGLTLFALINLYRSWRHRRSI